MFNSAGCRAVVACVFSMAVGRTASANDVDLPVVRAGSTRVDVEDGGRMLRGIWTVSPETGIDVYYARRAPGERRVTFRTDVDSISFDVRPGENHDFAVLLNGKRCCHTRISSMRESARLDGRDGSAAEDAIPFTLGRDGKIHIVGRFNDSEPLDLLLDLGADTLVVFPSGLAKGVKPRIDGSIRNLGTGGVATRQTSNDNRVALGRLRWEHESLLLIEKQSDRSDGIVGYNLLDGKVIAFDYDTHLIHIADRVPENAGAWGQLPVQFHGTLPGILVEFDAGAGPFAEWLALDTGSNLSAFLDRRAAARHRLYDSMQRLGSSEMRGVGAGSVRNEVVRLPTMTFGGHVLRDVPLHVEEESGQGGELDGHLGMDVLKRFNMVLDLRKDAVYLAPSALFDTNYSAVSGARAWWIAAGICALLLLAGGFFWLRRRARMMPPAAEARD